MKRVWRLSPQPHAKCIRFASGAGTVLMELCIVLPFVLAVVFGVIVYGIYMNAQTSLAVAVVNGTFLGIKRGDPRRLGYESEALEYPIAGMSELYENGTFTGDFATLLRSDDEAADFEATYLESFGEVMDFAGEFKRIPPAYWTALVYINEAMRQSVGSLRYPCKDEPRCLYCVPLNPQGITSVVSIPSEGFDPSSNSHSRFGFQCNYWLDAGLLNVAFRMLGLDKLSSDEAL